MSATDELRQFLNVLDTEEVKVFAKRLSANDTGATNSHQVGIYLPKEIAFDLSNTLSGGGTNPDCLFETNVLSHSVIRNNRLIWYNDKTRDECRITRWASDSKRNSVLRKELTGGLVVILFSVSKGQIKYSWAWFCSTPEQEDLLEERLGIVEPGSFLYNGIFSGDDSVSRSPKKKTDPCQIGPDRLPGQWHSEFPEGRDIVRFTFELLSAGKEVSDQRLILRRDCEFRIFRLVEDIHVLPRISAGFQTVDSFVDLANSVTNRRKSRSGKSFELHLEKIFDEESLFYTRGGKSEGKKSPDFLFPSAEHYRDGAWPADKIRMLGVKTTCKDRWRQILNEADRIDTKHLITLQEGVSIDQFKEMQSANVRLVVPTPLHRSYPEKIRHELISLADFISETKSICAL